MRVEVSYALGILASLSLLVGLARTGLADALTHQKAMRDALRAVEREDYEMALAILEPLADEGDSSAQHRLGILYRNGGKGLPQDHAKATMWFRKAAEQGHARSARSLAIAYEKGLGVTPDLAMALRWYQRAADKGDGLAQLALGVRYANGQGMPRDHVQAYKWLTLASSATFSEAEKEKREEALKIRTSIAQKMPPLEISDALRLAREWNAK